MLELLTPFSKSRAEQTSLLGYCYSPILLGWAEALIPTVYSLSKAAV